MKTPIEAVYENGVFRPLGPVNLPENTRVKVSIAGDGHDPIPDAMADPDFREHCLQEADDRVSIEEVREGLSSIKGSLVDAIREERDRR